LKKKLLQHSQEGAHDRIGATACGLKRRDVVPFDSEYWQTQLCMRPQKHAEAGTSPSPLRRTELSAPVRL